MGKPTNSSLVEWPPLSFSGATAMPTGVEIWAPCGLELPSERRMQRRVMHEFPSSEVQMLTPGAAIP